MSKFKVDEVLRLPSRGEVVFAGSVIEGRVAPGMRVRLELQEGLYTTIQIKSVEFIDRIALKQSLLGLLCAERSEKDADVYADLCPSGTVIEVEADASLA
jgi:hypothetical protein